MAIEKYELEIKRRNDEIERKTRDIDILNRRYVANLFVRSEAIGMYELEVSRGQTMRLRTLTE
eukprot:1158016-Pelagomonas_calceolata.AAC.7